MTARMSTLFFDEDSGRITIRNTLETDFYAKSRYQQLQEKEKAFYTSVMGPLKNFGSVPGEIIIDTRHNLGEYNHVVAMSNGWTDPEPLNEIGQTSAYYYPETGREFYREVLGEDKKWGAVIFDQEGNQYLSEYDQKAGVVATHVAGIAPRILAEDVSNLLLVIAREGRDVFIHTSTYAAARCEVIESPWDQVPSDPSIVRQQNPESKYRLLRDQGRKISLVIPTDELLERFPFIKDITIPSTLTLSKRNAPRRAMAITPA